MLEEGVVTELLGKGKTVKVEFERKTQCDNCGMCLAGKSNMRVHILVSNSCNAKVGDKVEIEMKDGVVILAAFVVYFIPLLFVVAGILIGILAKLQDIWTFVLAIGMLAISIVGVVCIDRQIKEKKKIVPTMKRILEDKQC